MAKLRERLRSVHLVSVLMMLSLFLGKATGQLRTILIGQRLGFASLFADGFSQGFLLPDFIYALLIGGSIQAAIVPYLSKNISMGKEKEAWKALSTFITTMGLLMLSFIFFVEWQASWIMSFFTTEASLEAAVEVTRGLMPQAFFMMMAGIIIGVLNSHRYFIAASLLPALYNTFVCICIYFFAEQNLSALYQTAFAISFTSGVYFFIQLLLAHRHLRFFRPRLDWRSEESKYLFYTAFPTLVSASIPMLTNFITSSYYHYFPDGTAYAYGNSSSVAMLPFGIFAITLGNMALPSLSAAFARIKQGEEQAKREQSNPLASVTNVSQKQEWESEAKEMFSNTLRKLALLIFPAAYMMVSYKTELVRAIFKWSSALTEETIQYTAGIMQYYSLFLIFFSFTYIINLFFFAQGKTRYALQASLFNLFSLALSIPLMIHVGKTGEKSMVIGLVIAQGIQMLYLLLRAKYESKRVFPQGILVYVFLSFLALLGMGFYIYGMQTLLGEALQARKLLQLGLLLFKGLSSYLVFWILAEMLGLFPNDLSLRSLLYRPIRRFFSKSQAE